MRTHRFWEAESDPRDNQLYRLPDDDAVALAGIVLVEAFTPSTICRLLGALPSLTQTPEEAARFIQERRRALGGAGFITLGPILPTHRSLFGLGVSDDELPEGVEAVWMRVYLSTPSLTLLVATFTFSPEAGDFSAVLRTTRATYAEGVTIRVRGRLGNMRSHLPWSRPADQHVSVSYGVADVRYQHQRAVDRRFRERTDSCACWLDSRAPGLFALKPSTDRPNARIVLTGQAEPFTPTSRQTWLGPAGLAGPFYWTAPDLPHWKVEVTPLAITAAVRRSDAYTPQDSTTDSTSNWHVSQRFHDDLSALISLWGMSAVLVDFDERLAKLRDDASRRRSLRHPTRGARAVNDFLLSTAFDFSAVATDVLRLTKDGWAYQREVPRFTESSPIRRSQHDTSGRAGEPQPDATPEGTGSAQGEPHADAVAGNAVGPAGFTNDESLGSSILGFHRVASELLLDDTRLTRDSLTASAQLRGLISNTRLQWAVVVLAIIAIAISIVAISHGGAASATDLHVPK
jgi:hypothetical protein